MMIRANYHQIVVIVIHGMNEFYNMMNLNNSLIIRFCEVITTDLAAVIIELL